MRQLDHKLAELPRAAISAALFWEATLDVFTGNMVLKLKFQKSSAQLHDSMQAT